MTIQCQICGGAARHRLTQTSPRLIDFYLCRDCGLLFAGTDISDEELSSFYAALDTGSYYDTVAETSRAKAERAVGDLAARLPDPATVVDLGCGGGHMLRAVEDKQPTWKAVGHDMDSASVNLCRSTGLQATTVMAELPTAEAVTMLDVAEHVKDPIRLFRDAHGLLGSGGTLYVHTPRRCMWDTGALALLKLPLLRKVGEMWLATRVSVYHLRLWSDDALRKVVTDSGFSLQDYSGEMELSWPVDRYVTSYVQGKFGAPAPVVGLARRLAHVVVRFKLLRNKAIPTATAVG